MNRILYRLIFNAARGCLMAVAEVARSCGKAASGEAGGSSGGSGGGSAGGGLGNGPVPAPVYMPNWPLVRVVIAQSTIKTVAIATTLVSIALPLQAHDARATSTAIATRLISDKKVEIGVGTKTELRGTQVQAPQIAFVHTDPAKAGELILGGSTNTTQTAHTEKTETAGLYQEMKGQGQTTQTLNQTQLHGNVHFDDSLSIEVQTATQANTASNTGSGIQTASLGAALAGAAPTSNTANPAQAKPSLSQSLQALREGAGAGDAGSGLEYLTQLQNRPGVKWKEVQLAHDNWSYDQAGLTPAGAALLTIAVAAATGGAGAELLGGTAATSTSAATLAGSTTLATMANAGFTALASQAAVSLVNNKGDIGKTLEQLGREESIKNVLTAMVTAGALDKLNASYFKGVDAKSPFTTQLQKNLTNNLASASIDAAISGKPLTQEALQASLKSALISTGTAQGANAIGDALVDGTLDTYTHKLAHAVLGCAGAAASGSQCSAGAVGAVVGELTAEYAKASGMSDDKALGLARVLAATSGVITGGGGDNAAAVNAAATAGGNAAENNYLKHAEALRLARLQDQQKAGSCGTQCQQDIADLKALDDARNQQLAACQGKSTAACDGARQDVRTAAAEYIRNGEILNTRGSTYAQEYIETTQLAYASIDNKRAGVLVAVGDMAKEFVSAMVTGYKAKDGDPAAIQQVVASSQAVKEFLSDTSNLPYLMGFMTPAQRQAFATAIEKNDGTTVGKMLTDQTLALASTISAVGGAAKLTTLSATALRDAAVAGRAAATAKTIATQLNNFYRDGAPANLIEQTFNAAAQASTHNPASTEVVLGRYIAGSENSYDAIAKARGATYFSMSDWSAVQGQLGAD